MIFNPAQPADKARVTTAYRHAMTIALAMTASVVLCMGLGLMISRTKADALHEELLIPFYAAGAMFALGALVFRRIAMQGSRLESVATRRGIAGLIGHLVTTTVIAGALAEVVALLGLLLGFLSGELTHVIRLGVVALAVSVYNFPRLKAWQRAIEYFEQTTAAGAK